LNAIYQQLEKKYVDFIFVLSDGFCHTIEIRWKNTHSSSKSVLFFMSKYLHLIFCHINMILA
jgi:hypothetical protein